MQQPSTVKIFHLPSGFSSSSSRGADKLEKRSSIHTALTEDCSFRTSARSERSCSSVGSICSSACDDFNISLTDISDVTHEKNEAQDALAELKTVGEGRVDALARKLAQLEEQARSEKRKLRKMQRQARINKAHQDYLECLQALTETELHDKAPELNDEKFLKEKGLEWKEVELDW